MAGFVKSMFGEGEMGARLRELDMRLRKIGLEQEDVKGDGNCFYHALVKQLQRHEVPNKHSSCNDTSVHRLICSDLEPH